ncbi:MAG: purine-nucleoside phosphorylase [Candidatus Marinimicrobia bacterium]|nr:purine-nucleoside phosphorylase [Candidatus Neomarinimicrobiota bacterium]MBL7022932.1 purine-nucleoside phosphorylase [Candidatus Neomarinimicrobiota bacterium]MBL7108750.1 purine-nucleoside phosphorylase [Candidatus Neomarinimicrobiota bacterium]
MNLNQISEFIQSRLPQSPKVAVVLGSGLSYFSNNLKHTISIPYNEIPGYLQPSVTGHIGEFVFGYVNDLPVLCTRGRFHYYEGYSMDIVQFPVKLFHSLGCETLIITNAAGCLRRNWNLGDLMIINGLLDYTFRKSGENPKIMSEIFCFNENLIKSTKSIAKQNNITIREGVYCWTLGPSYETPAEIQEIIQLGGDAVGMSTVPEIEIAHKLGLNILGISCLTNYGAGLSDQPLTHSEVLETSERVKDSFAYLLLGILKEIN